MKCRNSVFVLMLIASACITAVTACSEPAPIAQFDVTSLTIKPTQVTVRETFNVTATITNIGSTTGIYNAVLTVDGSKADSKAVSLGVGSSETVSFSLSKNKAGKYKIAVGNSSQNLEISPKMAEQKTELKYDDGLATDFLTVDKPCSGYVVSFDPPSELFTIDTVKICGFIYGGRGLTINEMYLQIWDKENKVKYNAQIEKDQFTLLTYLPSETAKQGEWASFPIPDVKVNGRFYIHLYTGIVSGQGFRMGADDSVTNTHSDITVRDSNGADSISTNWNYPVARWYGDKSRVNWMVRVSGTAWITEE